MASFVDICNRALTRLGQSPIVSLDDGTSAANACKRSLQFVTDSVFRDHPWNCLVVRKSIAPLQSVPAYEYSSEYQLPSDCLRVIDVRPSDGGASSRPRYTIEGRKILTNAADGLNIRYLANIQDPNIYDGLLREAIACYMAATLAEEITQSNTKRELAWSEYQDILTRAKRSDAQENPPNGFVESEWVSTRYSGYR